MLLKQVLSRPLSRALATSSSHRVGNTKVTLIPGDGIGPEVMAATRQIIQHVKAPIEFEEHNVSEIQGYTEAQVQECIDSMNRNKAVLQGFILAAPQQTFGKKLSLQMEMRRDLDIFANVSHIKTYDGVDTRYRNIDIITIRETTEGEYCGEEHESVPGVVESLKLTTDEKCRRVAKFAFDYALKHDRKKVTCVHKANIMKLGDGLFRRVCTEVSEMYPSIQFEDMIVDNTCMQLVSNPYQFDVMVLPNLYGNIVENLGAGLIGGAGLQSGASYSENVAIFGAGARYTFSSGAGQDKANPTAIFMSAGNLCAHLGLSEYGNSIKNAVRKTLRKGSVRTVDIGGKAGLSEFTDAVCANLKAVN